MKQRTFPGTRGSDYRDGFAALHGKGDVFENRHHAAVFGVAFTDML